MAPGRPFSSGGVKSFVEEHLHENFSHVADGKDDAGFGAELPAAEQER